MIPTVDFLRLVLKKYQMGFKNVMQCFVGASEALLFARKKLLSPAVSPATCVVLVLLQPLA